MGWKEMHYWLRGGIIACILGFVFLLLYFSNIGAIFQDCKALEKAYPGTICINVFNSLLNYLFNYISIPAYPLFQLIPNASFAYMKSAPFVSVIFLFVYGAIIGWIIGKIRSKND